MPLAFSLSAFCIYSLWTVSLSKVDLLCVCRHLLPLLSNATALCWHLQEKFQNGFRQLFRRCPCRMICGKPSNDEFTMCMRAETVESRHATATAHNVVVSVQTHPPTHKRRAGYGLRQWSCQTVTSTRSALWTHPRHWLVFTAQQSRPSASAVISVTVTRQPSKEYWIKEILLIKSKFICRK